MNQVKFKYIPIEGADTDAIGILEGDYEGLHYHYGTVSFNEQEDGQMEMKFNYEILNKPDGFEDDEKFKNFAGDLLVRILEEQLPSLTQETSYDGIGDAPSFLTDNLEDLKKEQDEQRDGALNAASGTDNTSESDSL